MTSSSTPARARYAGLAARVCATGPAPCSPPGLNPPPGSPASQTYTQYGYCKDSRFRPTVQKAGGKMMFPYLEDPNTRKVMYDSDAIVAYLLKEYAADATLPLNYRFALTPIGKRVRMMGFVLSRMLFRCLPYHGSLRVPARHPIKVMQGT